MAIPPDQQTSRKGESAMTAAEQQLETFTTAAHALGVDAAKSAASWVTDGNATDAHYARLIRMMDEGDPQLWDHLPTMPNLSGEWADAPTSQSLAADIVGADWETHGNNAPDFIPGALVS